MKLDIKKLALILAASIFAFSGVFGQERARVAGEAERADMGKDNMFKKIKLINDADDREIEIEVNKDQESKAKLSGDDTEDVDGRINTIDLTIKKTGLFGLGGKEKKVRIDLSKARENKDAIMQEIRDNVNRELKDRGLALTVDKDNDTLVLTVRDAGGVQADKTTKDVDAKRLY